MADNTFFGETDFDDPGELAPISGLAFNLAQLFLGQNQGLQNLAGISDSITLQAKKRDLAEDAERAAKKGGGISGALSGALSGGASGFALGGPIGGIVGAVGGAAGGGFAGSAGLSPELVGQVGQLGGQAGGFIGGKIQNAFSPFVPTGTAGGTKPPAGSFDFLGDKSAASTVTPSIEKAVGFGTTEAIPLPTPQSVQTGQGTLGAQDASSPKQKSLIQKLNAPETIESAIPTLGAPDDGGVLTNQVSEFPAGSPMDSISRHSKRGKEFTKHLFNRLKVMFGDPNLAGTAKEIFDQLMKGKTTSGERI